MYDPKNFQREWRLEEPVKVDDKGHLTGLVFNRSSLGPMCSDRVLFYKFELKRDEANPKKLHMQIYSTSKEGCPMPEGSVEATLFKQGTYE